MEPEYRGATARRLMREAQENAALYAKDTERVMAQRDEARKEAATLRAQLTEEKANAEGFHTVAANLSDQLDGCLRENAGLPFLMEMIAEMRGPVTFAEALAPHLAKAFGNAPEDVPTILIELPKAE
jgi:hypothetical protein